MSREYTTFSESGMMGFDIYHEGMENIDSVVALLSQFIREKNSAIEPEWPQKKIKETIKKALKAVGSEDKEVILPCQ